MIEDEYSGSDLFNKEDFSSIRRRDFLKLLGGGIIIFFSSGELGSLQEEARRRGMTPGLPSDFNAFLRIGEDGRVTCFTGKIEMGQGIITSLAQMLAEELDVTLGAVDMVMGDTDLCPWDMGTFGSLTTRNFGPPLRAAAAEAKAVLIALASEYLQVPAERLKAQDGVIFDSIHKERRVSYAELAKGKKIERHVEKKPDLKAVAELTVIGKSVLRRDALEKVAGKAKYSGDIRLPGMVYAKILRPPAHGAALKSVNVSAAENISGVQIIRDGDLIAVLHEHPDKAEEALSKIKAQFDLPEAKVDDKTIFDHLVKMAPEGRVVAKGGDVSEGEKQAASLFEETYLNSYVAHAPVETHTAVASVEGGKAIVWASTQTPFRAKDEIAQAIGIPPENVRVITPFVGGGFGGKTRNQQAVEAARLAKLSGKPVQVAWSRAEEFFYDTFRPAAVVKIKSGVDGSGRIHLWDYNVYFAGERCSQQFYEIAHHRTTVRGEWMGGGTGAHPLGVGAWRAPACNTNCFARESHIDIMASAVKSDPLEFRLNNLADKRMQRVLEAVARKFGWEPAPGPSGRGYGLACGDYLGTYVATMAEVNVDKENGRIGVKRVVCAQDMGLVINPEGAKLQIEGCITMGLGYVLAEEIRFKGGEVLDVNFDTYEIPRFSWLPEIETVLIDARDIPAQGGGEPAIILMGAVIANAVFDAAGVRLFQLPMTPERVRTALQNL